MSDHPAVVVRELSRRFGHRPAVNRVSFEVGAGEVLTLFGPNGSGKTTLLRMLGSTLRPSGGTFSVCGLDPRRDGPAMRGRIGALYPPGFLYDQLSSRENLEFFARLHGVRHPARRAAALLHELQLEDWAFIPVAALSKGLHQRVALARCLVHEPAVLLLDEPFSGLDVRSAESFAGTLRGLRGRGSTILLVTHNVERGLALSDRWILLDRGRIVGTGRSVDGATAAFRRIYLGRGSTDDHAPEEPRA